MDIAAVLPSASASVQEEGVEKKRIAAAAAATKVSPFPEEETALLREGLV